jgi:D-galactarolactone cycloisomerase
LEQCRADVVLGHRGFKLKIGRGNRWMERTAGDRRDIEVTRAVREAFPAARILVDANDGYDLDGFRRYVDAVADVGLYWVEEPFLDDADDLRSLREHLDAVSPGTRIAEGETSPDVDALLPAARAGWIDVLLMDVLSYGITRWRRLMPALRDDRITASPHAWGRPLKTLYAAQLAAGLGGIDIVEGVPGDTDGVDATGYRFVDGALTVPDRPGFGLSLPPAECIRPIM